MNHDGKVSAGQEPRQPVYDSYARLSRVPETGELEKIETQFEDNKVKIDRLGGVLGEELSDGLSAWKRGVRRKGWERLLARVESGESDGIVVWHTDRLFRQPRDLETLIELGDKGFTIASAHGARDLADPDDRFILRIEVAHAARSSDDTSRRAKRRFQVLRAKGQAHHHGRAFGFPGTDRSTGTLVKDTPKEQRAAVSAELVAWERQALRDAVKDVLAGLPYTRLADQWNAAGLRTTTGKQWVPTLVRDVLLRPTNAGLVEHDGVIVGRVEGEAILGEDDFLRLRAKFVGRKRGRVAGERYLASGILRCDRCGRPVSGRPHTGTYPDGSTRRQYHCAKSRGGCGKVAADVRAVDRELRALVITRLSDRRHAAALTAYRAQVADRLAEVEAEIEECERLQAALSDRLGRRQITLDAFDVANEPLVADLAQLNAEREKLTGGESVEAVPVASAEQMAAQWDNPATGLAQRRAWVSSALGRERLYLVPADGARTFSGERRLRRETPDQRAARLATAQAG